MQEPPVTQNTLLTDRPICRNYPCEPGMSLIMPSDIFFSTLLHLSVCRAALRRTECNITRWSSFNLGTDSQGCEGRYFWINYTHSLLIPVNLAKVSICIIPLLCYQHLKKKKTTRFFFPSPRGFKRRQRHKLQEIYYCSIWQEPEKQDIYKMNSNVCRETLQVCEDSELRLHLILKKINLYQTYKQLVEKRQAIIVYVFEKLLQRFLFLPFHHIACIKPTVQSTCDVLTGGAASQPYLSSVRFMSRSKA